MFEVISAKYLVEADVSKDFSAVTLVFDRQKEKVYFLDLKTGNVYKKAMDCCPQVIFGDDRDNILLLDCSAHAFVCSPFSGEYKRHRTFETLDVSTACTDGESFYIADAFFKKNKSDFTWCVRRVNKNENEILFYFGKTAPDGSPTIFRNVPDEDNFPKTIGYYTSEPTSNIDSLNAANGFLYISGTSECRSGHKHYILKRDIKTGAVSEIKTNMPTVIINNGKKYYPGQIRFNVKYGYFAGAYHLPNPPENIRDSLLVVFDINGNEKFRHNIITDTYCLNQIAITFTNNNDLVYFPFLNVSYKQYDEKVYFLDLRTFTFFPAEEKEDIVFRHSNLNAAGNLFVRWEEFSKKKLGIMYSFEDEATCMKLREGILNCAKNDEKLSKLIYGS